LAAVVLAAVTVFATFIDNSYRRVLEEASDSMSAALLPYRIVATLSGISALIAILGALIWPGLPVAWKGIVLGVATGCSAWAIIGTVQLSSLTLWHAEMRARLMRGIEDAETLLARRRREKRSA
jgi:hypothetical protein